MTTPHVFIYDTPFGQLRLNIESRHRAKLTPVDQAINADGGLTLGEWSILTSDDRFIISHQTLTDEGAIEFTRYYPTSGLHKRTDSYFNYSDTAPSGVFTMPGGIYHEEINSEMLIEELKLVSKLITEPSLLHTLGQLFNFNHPELYFVQDVNVGPTSLSAIQECLGNEGAAEWLESLIASLADNLVDVRD